MNPSKFLSIVAALIAFRRTWAMDGQKKEEWLETIRSRKL